MGSPALHAAAHASEAVILHLRPPADAVKSFSDGFAVSPDGRKLAFSSLSSKGERLLWVRSLARAQPEPLAGTNGATRPFWSPDGTEMAFFASGKLRRIPAEGGPTQVVPGYRAMRTRGGSWGGDGSILFSIDGGGVSRVEAAGGPVASVVSSRQGGVMPFALPDPKRFLYDANGELFVGPTDDGKPPSAIAGIVDAKHAELVAPDRLVFLDQSARSLLAARRPRPRTSAWRAPGPLRERRLGRGVARLQRLPFGRAGLPREPARIAERVREPDAVGGSERTHPGSLGVGSPKPLFRMVMADIMLGLQPPYDVAPDGKRFLVLVPQVAPAPLTFVQSWTALLKRYR